MTTTGRVDILTVTYGNRSEFLLQMLNRVVDDPLVRSITIVDNLSSCNINELTAQLPGSKISVLHLDQNYGSAHGYKYGLEMLQKNAETEFIFLLDDDNVPDPGCISKMIEFWGTLHEEDKNIKTMLLGLRPNRKYLQNAARGNKPHLFFPLPNHFLGFNILRPDLWLLKKFYPLSIKNNPYRDVVSIPCAPYGGLFFHKDILQRIGWPDTRYVTYADDFEYTFRHTSSGGKIFLLPACIIQDIDIPFVNRSQSGILRIKFLDMEPQRLFFLMRNTAWFTKQYLVTRPMIFTINRLIYTTYLAFIALIHRRQKSFSLFNFAVRRGLRGDFETGPPIDSNREEV